MKKHNILLIGSMVLTLGAGSAVGYGVYKDRQAGQARAGEVRALVERFKGCPERYAAHRECFTDEERSSMLTEAEGHRDDGRFKEAARIYLKLGREEDARLMAGRCSKADRAAVLDELAMRREAADIVRREASQ